MNTSVLLVNLVSAVLLPPLSLVLSCLAGLLLRRHWPRVGTALSGASFLLLLVLSTKAGAGLLVAPLERGVAPLASPAGSGAQAIVVLGGGRLSRAPEYGGADIPNGADLARLRYAARLHRETRLPILLTGGKPDGSSESEARIMARALREDFHASAQWLEEDANNTAENAVLSAGILRGADIKRVLLVTDALHMSRARAAFERAGLEVVAAPTGFLGTERRTPLDFIPEVKDYAAAITCCMNG